MKTRRLGTVLLAASLFTWQWQADANAGWYQYKSNTALMIPDTGTFMGRSTIFVPDTFGISDVMVKLDIEHAWVGDLTVFLTAPNGFWLGVVGYPIDWQNTLSNRPIYGANYGMEFVAGRGYSFVDSAAAGLPPEPTTTGASWQIPGGSYLPEDDAGLKFKDMFDGTTDPQGYWHIDIFDNAIGDGGNLLSWQLDFNQDALYFPSIKDNDAIGWENTLSVQAKDPVLMDVKIRVYNLAGDQMGQFIYSDTDPAANKPAILPNARVAQRPSQIAGSTTSPIAVEGSIIVETSVPAIGSTNAIANNYNGFSIYEAAKKRQVHNFPKAFDGPNAPSYQVYMLAQNIYDHDINVTVKLFGKTALDPGHGATKTYTLHKYGTLKVRPIEVAPLDATGKQISFSGSVVIYSDLATPGDGMGQPIPAMCRYEAGAYAMGIYESTVEQPSLQFPNMKDGKFGGSLDYQNFLSVVNMSLTDSAVINVYAYDNSGNLKGSSLNVSIPPNGKKTWRPSQLPPGSIAVPNDFEGSVVVTSSIPVVGQTNTIYPGTNAYGAEGFDLFESAMLSKSLFFPKAYDGLPGGGTIGSTKLTDNYVYVQNPTATAKSIKIEQFNNNGTANGLKIVALPAYATYSWMPRDGSADGLPAFRGSIKVTEQSGLMIAGAIKYELHNTTLATSKIDNMCFYRSMGQ